MKAYVITDPEKFKEAASMMKWQGEKKKAESFAKVWSAQTRKGDENAKRMSARIEVGRTAQLFQQIGDKRNLLGTMWLTSARKFVQDMEAAK